MSSSDAMRTLVDGLLDEQLDSTPTIDQVSYLNGSTDDIRCDYVLTSKCKNYSICWHGCRLYSLCPKRYESPLTWRILGLIKIMIDVHESDNAFDALVLELDKKHNKQGVSLLKSIISAIASTLSDRTNMFLLPLLLDERIVTHETGTHETGTQDQCDTFYNDMTSHLHDELTKKMSDKLSSMIDTANTVDELKQIHLFMQDIYKQE